MGIITRIEDKLRDIVENPFKEKNCLDLAGIEVSLKRIIERNRKNVLGKVVLPNFIEIHINEKEYAENELFFGEFRRELYRSITEWMREKVYEMAKGMEIHFIKDCLEKRPFDIFVSFKKMEKEGIDDHRIKEGENKIILGWLICEKTSERFEIYGEFMIIGRGEDCTIRINDPTVSRRHASLQHQSGKMILEDLGSKTGTWVNHERINKKILSDGDTIVIGCTELTYIEADRISGGVECGEILKGQIKGNLPEKTSEESKVNCLNYNLLGLSYFF